MANALKDQGNSAFAAKDYARAIDLFTQAIAIDSSNHVLYSNRSAAHAGNKDWTHALEDAEQCIKLNPNWSKGYARKGAALHGAHRYDDAIATYEAGLKLEDSPALRKGLREVQDAKGGAAAEDPLGFGKMFSDPSLLAKLAANPKTAKHLADPSFMQMLLRTNPKLANSFLQSDPRMIDVLGVMLGIDMQGFSRPEGSSDFDPDLPQHGETTKPSPTSPQPGPSTTPPPSAGHPPQRTPQKEEDAEMEEADDEDAHSKREAGAAKAAGSAAYKKRDFAEAATQYAKAWELWPKDMTFLTNLGAAYFEQGEYDKCIETCEKAVEEGRSLRADFKLIAKALGRIGSSYDKKSDLTNAIKYYEKSLTEHRTPDVLTKLRGAERAAAEVARKAYIDPDKSAIAREEGNRLFKEGSFAEAVKSYTEAIQRDPSDARGYNNRAAAYQKLVALPEALKDAEEAIKIDPTFVKAYIRKSNILVGMRDYTKALEVVQEAEDHDTDGKHKAEIQQEAFKCQQALFTQRAGESEEDTLNRAMRDPEIAGIMTDPVMQQILQQAQGNPAALQDHMKNPIVRGKIMKLVNAGIIRMR